VVVVREKVMFERIGRLALKTLALAAVVLTSGGCVIDSVMTLVEERIVLPEAPEFDGPIAIIVTRWGSKPSEEPVRSVDLEFGNTRYRVDHLNNRTYLLQQKVSGKRVYRQRVNATELNRERSIAPTTERMRSWGGAREDE